MKSTTARKDKLNFVHITLLLLFSIVTAIGSFNPLGNGNIEDSANSSSPLALLIQGLFIASLFIVKSSSTFLKTEFRLLCLFGLIWSFSSILFSQETLNISFSMSIIKLLLCIVLFYKLPQLLIREPRWLIYSLLAFSITSAIIATLFSLGLLDSYVLWSKGRAYIFYENPNSTSTRMLFAFMFIIYLIFQDPLRWGKIRFFCSVLILPLLYSIIASGSRGSFIVLIVCFGLYLLMIPTRKSGRKFSVIILSVLIALSVIMKISESENFSLMERLSESIEKKDDAGRTQLSAAALDIFLDYPIIGVGSVEFIRLMEVNYGFRLTVHNLYWYIAATSGIVGLTLFGFFIWNMLRFTWNVRCQNPFGFVLLIGMLLIASKTGGALSYMTMWYIFALSMSFIKITKFS